ncbi:MAG: LLM class flavin-dependent oxidoreductase [Solirubrobacteraceae bacterium]|nr:LLM class flavin-dependent oxidoreductase [Solirubrobacteraceae bacterium]
MTQIGLTCGGVWWEPDLFQEIERLGFDSIWTGEHIVFHRPILDAISVVAGLAAVTERVEIGPAAIMVPLRHPTLLAKELASIDIMSNGRLIVTAGVGGEYPKEFEACGVPHPRRGRRTTEMVEIMRKYWTEERFSYHGELLKLDNVWMEPKPVSPGGPRIWMAGRSNAAIERAVRHGDGYMPYMFTPEQCADSMRRIRETSERLEQPLRPNFTLSAFIYTSLHDDREYARRLAVEDLGWRYNQPFDRLVDKYCVYGTAEQVNEQLQAFVDAGVTHFVLAPVQEKGGEREVVARYAEDVLGPMKASAAVKAA